jgi:biotin carboxyl carrier protein
MADARGGGILPAGRAEAIADLADEVVPRLAARLNQSGLAELEVRHGDWRVRIRRDRGAPAVITVAGERARSGSADPGGATRPASPPPATGAAEGRVVRSPAVGYFAPVDGLAAGRGVRSGDVIGHIEVLGVRQEVVVQADGRVARVLVAHGQAVEYGQDLVEVDSAGQA